MMLVLIGFDMREHISVYEMPHASRTISMEDRMQIFFSHLEIGIANTHIHFPCHGINVAKLRAQYNHHLYQRIASVLCVQKTHFRYSCHFSPPCGTNSFRTCESWFMQKNIFILFHRRLGLWRTRQTKRERALKQCQPPSQRWRGLATLSTAIIFFLCFLFVFLFCICALYSLVSVSLVYKFPRVRIWALTLPKCFFFHSSADNSRGSWSKTAICACLLNVAHTHGNNGSPKNACTSVLND